MATLNLLELMNGKFFRMPEYQRGFDWEEKQLTELWDDLNNISEENGMFKKHYTGTIYLKEGQPNDNEKWLLGVNFYDVVDGQQRLTTLCILIFELLKITTEGYCNESKNDLATTYLYKQNSNRNSTIYKFGYSQNDKNYNFLLRNIFENNIVIVENENINSHTTHLTNAKDFFSKRLKALSPGEHEILFRKLTTSLQFDVRVIEKDLDAQAFLERMNIQGKPQSIIKN